MWKKCVILACWCVILCSSKSGNHVSELTDIKNKVRKWSKGIGKIINDISVTMTRRNRVIESFKPLKDIIYADDGEILINTVAQDIRTTMQKKVEAVQRISEYAEFLAYHRETKEIPTDGDFYFYNAENITTTTSNLPLKRELQEEIREAECDWWCHQKDLSNIPHNKYNNIEIQKLFSFKDPTESRKECDCVNLPDRRRPQKHYNSLPLQPNPKYDMEVNEKLSVVKINTNIYDRDQNVLQGVKWTEPLDMVFKENLKKDPTLNFQYFTSPYGYMRHFPAVQWSKESYDVTYDPRTRSWYTEAMTSPKDIIILLDRSGSMEGNKRKLSAHIVNNILDTLNDNDFVTIFTFTNTTEPLVSCFGDKLVQANEENLRLLRESLDVYKIKFVADIALGLKKALQILETHRNERSSSNCNQAIMLLSEGLDYNHEPEKWGVLNERCQKCVRIFTYALESGEGDSRVMEKISCDNRGYFVNVTLLEEVREKILPYLNVMSRPVNYLVSKRQDPIWSYLYIDLADRRYSNWLWRKFEGIRQREIFLDHAKREIFRLKKFWTSENNMLLQESHEYEKYKDPHDFNYMTTVSLPVYGRRDEDVDLVGVAGVDVPIKLLYSLIPHHKLGVNGYAFIVTNNGYVVMHPAHRREFENIPKPTFNRVDLLEVEILDDSSKPRLFDKSIVELRENIVRRRKGEESAILKVKFALDDMKRIILSKRRYHYTEIGPFSLGIALPDPYGLMIVNNKKLFNSVEDMRWMEEVLVNSGNWTVHPHWVYCRDSGEGSPEDTIRNCLKRMNGRSARREPKPLPLFTTLLFDINVTSWFKDEIPREDHFIQEHFVDNVFLATHSGLTRWKIFENSMDVYDDPNNMQDLIRGNKAIDEDWYRRAVEENYHNNENMFIYSVPFEISGFENSTVITSTSAVFVKHNNTTKTPIAAVGVQFNHREMHNIFTNMTGREGCNSPLSCYILDNNAYVILSNDIEYTGRFLGDIRPDIMLHLVDGHVYKATHMFDYQAICQKLPPTAKSEKSSATTLRQFVANLAHLAQWVFATIVMLISSVACVEQERYQSIKNDTLAFERLEISKTFPTPCDQELWLFTLGKNFETTFVPKNATKSKFDCEWMYVVERIPESNLIFLAINSDCNVDTVNTYQKTPTPTEIHYNDSLPCHIAIHNKFTRRVYMKCYNRNETEDTLNQQNHTYCGRTWQ